MKGVRVGGRKKGTPNKRTKEAHAIADRVKCDPFEILCYFAKGDWKGLGYKEPVVIELNTRAKAAADAAKYLYPQRKATELSTSEDGMRIIIEDYGGKKPK